MKRKREDLLNPGVYTGTRSKRPRLVSEYVLPPRKYNRVSWVNGTDVRNYMLRDPLVDWLKLTKRDLDHKTDPFFDFITQKGNEFENQIVQFIHENKLPVVTIGNRITHKSCQETIRLMRAGAPIIHSAPFKSQKQGIRGIADFLVRSDFLHIFTGENPLPFNLQKFPAPKLNGQYHYVVIDVKFSTLPLRADGIHLLNAAGYPAYKAQLWIYTQCVGEIQGYTPHYAYILGRRYRYTSKGEIFSSLNCLDKLGVINYQGVDSEYAGKTVDAINWLKELRQDGKTWSISPPSRPELYPNMCVDSGYWNSAKQQIAEQIGEITQIWYCGVRNREKAMQSGITTWRDPRCCSKTIGMNGSRTETIDKIISINRQDTHKILPAVIQTNLHDWRNGCNEIFVDFETFADVFAPFDDLPAQPKTNRIYMIGVWYKNGNNWDYRNFLANEATSDEEYRITDEFARFVQEQKNPKLWYWHAEKSFWDRVENTHMDISCENKDFSKSDHIVANWKLQNWADLCQVFRAEPIVIKDCFKFGLKEIAKSLHKHGLIQTEMKSNCHSGLDASVMAWQVYQKGQDVLNSPEMADIIKYNVFDVKILWEILTYLRTRH